MAYKIISKFFDSGNVNINIIETETKEKPSSETRDYYDIYIDYVDTKEEVKDYLV